MSYLTFLLWSWLGFYLKKDAIKYGKDSTKRCWKQSHEFAGAVREGYLEVSALVHDLLPMWLGIAELDLFQFPGKDQSLPTLPPVFLSLPIPFHTFHTSDVG